ncbi:TPA: hypothetical protein TVN86_001971 [Streptococcus equi subsp. zooepidemicus]|nr:hypothetical protein [Streptococcus equi subsp. zooepidemicus]HEL1117304.1 hypothetical protein [Streptococcus equi subsp. zooepidemicus]HEL1170491.1 hypothetical protein [Streptococcus equi subsp. zooepidemicus]HEL1171876.1 hypothetical protein [Streptococcus equi subsp. zooepidemicus]HEL1223327.1 hypothetical protein [Streptococcus equi subsp. zooepidemicus]
MKKEKKSLHNKILEIREKIKQAESIRGYIEKLQQENKGLTQTKKQG